MQCLTLSALTLLTIRAEKSSALQALNKKNLHLY